MVGGGEGVEGQIRVEFDEVADVTVDNGVEVSFKICFQSSFSSSLPASEG